MPQNEAQMTPQQHAGHIASLLHEARQECRADINRVDDVKAQALFETVAEVLGGAMEALSDYQSGSERIWQTPTSSASARPQGPTVSDFRVDVDAAGPPPRLVDEIPRDKRAGE